MIDLNIRNISVQKKELEGSHTSPSFREHENQEDNSVKINKTISFLFAFCLTYGNIVGSGIFISVSETLTTFDSNSIGMTVIFWIIGGIISVIGGLCYAELGVRIPESGGERAYYRKILDEKISRTFVILFVFVIKTLTLAALAITTGKYFNAIFGSESKNNVYLEKAIAVTILILCFIVNCISKVISNKLGVVMTVLKTTAMLIIIGGGIYSLFYGSTTEWKKPFLLKGYSWDRFGICFINIFWSYESWNTLGLVAGDMKNPSRDLPKAIFFGLFVVILMYVFTVISYVAIIGYDAARISVTIAEEASKKILFQATPLMLILVCCSTAGSANGTFFAISSVAASAGFRGEIFKIFSLVHKKRRTPILSLFVLLLISICFCFFEFQTLLNYCAFISWIFYSISFICLWKIKLETRETKLTGIFQIPYIFIVPMQIVSVLVIWVTFKEHRIGCSAFGLIFVLIIGVQYISKDILPLSTYELQNKLIEFFSSFNLETAKLEDFS